jgi:hypothetical protein
MFKLFKHIYDLCMYLYVYLSMYVCMHACMYVYIYICTDLYIYINECSIVGRGSKPTNTQRPRHDGPVEVLETS